MPLNRGFLIRGGLSPASVTAGNFPTKGSIPVTHKPVNRPTPTPPSPTFNRIPGSIAVKKSNQKAR